MTTAATMNVSNQLRDAIRESGLSMYMVGKRAGIDPTTVASFLKGGQLRTDSLDGICEVLGLELRKKEDA